MHTWDLNKLLSQKRKNRKANIKDWGILGEHTNGEKLVKGYVTV